MPFNSNFSDFFKKETKEIVKSINKEKKIKKERENDILNLFSQMPFLDDGLASKFLLEYFQEKDSNILNRFKLFSLITRINPEFWVVSEDIKQKIEYKEFDYKKISDITKKFIENQKNISETKALQYLLIYSKILLYIEDEASSVTKKFIEAVNESENNFKILKIIDKQLEDFISLSKNKNSEAMREAYFLKAKFLKKIKKYQKAKVYFEKVMKFSKKDEILAETYQLYGHLLYKEFHQIEKAKIFLEKSLRILDEDTFLKSKSYSILGNIYIKENVYKAEKYFNESLNIKKIINDKKGEALILHDIGIIYKLRKKFNEAEKYFNRSLEIERKINNKEGEAKVLHNMGRMYYELKRENGFDKAEKYYKDSLSILKIQNDKIGEAQVLHDMGIIYFKLKKDFNKAINYFEESLRIGEELKYKNHQAKILNNIGNIYYQLKKDYKNAELYLNKSLTLKKEINDKTGQIITLELLADISKDKGDLDKAYSYYKEANEICKKTRRNKNICFNINMKMGTVYE